MQNNSENNYIEEILDIVDDNDNIIGKALRSDIYKNNNINFRVINGFLINSQKQVWIPIRSADKILFPSCLDASVGGHVSHGENYEQAFFRESLEELNIDVSKHEYRLIAKLNGKKDNVSAFMHVYVIYSDATPIYNLNDFVSAHWYSIQDLKNKINGGYSAKGDLAELITVLEKFICE